MTAGRKLRIALCWPLLLLTIELCIPPSAAAPCNCNSNPHQHQSTDCGHTMFHQKLFDRNIKLQLGFQSDPRNQISNLECIQVNANPKYQQCKVMLKQNEDEKMAVINVAPLIVSIDGQYQTPDAKASIVNRPDLTQHSVTPGDYVLSQFGINLLRIVTDSLVKDIVNSVKQALISPNLFIPQIEVPDKPSKELRTTITQLINNKINGQHIEVSPQHPIGITPIEKDKQENPAEQMHSSTPHNNEQKADQENEDPVTEAEQTEVPSGVQKTGKVLLEQPGSSENSPEVPSQDNVGHQEERDASPLSSSNGRRSNSDVKSFTDSKSETNSIRRSDVFLLPMGQGKHPFIRPQSGAESKNNIPTDHQTTFNRKPQKFGDQPQVANIQQNYKVENADKNVIVGEYVQPSKQNKMKDNSRMQSGVVTNEMRSPQPDVKMTLQDIAGNTRKHGEKYSLNDLTLFLKSLGINDNAAKVKVILNAFASSPYLTMDIDSIFLAYKARSLSKYVILQYVMFKLVQNQAGIKLLRPGEERRMYEVLASLGKSVSLEAEALKAGSNPASYGSGRGIIMRPLSFYGHKPLLPLKIIPHLSGGNSVIRYAIVPPAPPAPPPYPAPTPYLNSNMVRYFVG